MSNELIEVSRWHLELLRCVGPVVVQIRGLGELVVNNAAFRVTIRQSHEGSPACGLEGRGKDNPRANKDS